MKARLNVLVVDDSVVYRRILVETLKSIDAVNTINYSSSGNRALQILETEPANIVLLDVEMPEMDGVETLKEIKKRYPQIEVIMISAVNERGASKVMESLNHGALEFIQKPSSSSHDENKKELLESLLNVFQVVQAHQTQKDNLSLKPLKTANVKPTVPPPSFFDLVAIGVSTGGPDSLAQVIPQIPRDFQVPIVLVQHMPPVFTKELAHSLDQKSILTVVEAAEGNELSPGCVYIAPGGYHMTVKNKKISLNTDPPENSCRPAVDVLFRSIAQGSSYSNILSVILTGMGNDGTIGVECLKETKRAWCLSQSEKTCVVYGMPRGVDEAGLTDEQVDLQDIPYRITQLVKK